MTLSIILTIDTDGEITWWLYNSSQPLSYPHNNNGPAISFISGRKEWWVNGNQHRLDGPACEFADNTKDWFINDKEYYTELEYWLAVQQYVDIHQHNIL